MKDLTARQLLTRDPNERRIEIEAVDLEAVLLGEQFRVLGGPARDVENRPRPRVLASNGRAAVFRNALQRAYT